jgi:hypothetical protein
MDREKKNAEMLQAMSFAISLETADAVENNLYLGQISNLSIFPSVQVTILSSLALGETVDNLDTIKDASHHVRRLYRCTH